MKKKEMQERRILIMEDTPFWGIMLGRELAKLGVESDWVKNGRLGLEKVRSDQNFYHGIITDVQMPIMDGIEATREIRKLGFKKVIIGFSSMGEEEDINKGLDAGMNGYYRKTIAHESIKALLKHMELY